jgi:hypothetical protein
MPKRVKGTNLKREDSFFKQSFTGLLTLCACISEVLLLLFKKELIPNKVLPCRNTCTAALHIFAPT